MSPYQHALLLMAPIVTAGVVHQVIRALNWFARLRRSLDDLAFRGRELFGANKTLRGFIVFPFACSAAFAAEGALDARWAGALGTCPARTGLVVGLAYMAGELPNSYLKRRLKIAPGATATRGRGLFFLLDHVDSASSGSLALLALGFPWRAVAVGFLLAPLVHVMVNLASYALTLRNTPC